MKMTTEEAFIKVLQMHGNRACVWHHRLGHDADLRPVSRRRYQVLGTVPTNAPPE